MHVPTRHKGALTKAVKDLALPCTGSGLPADSPAPDMRDITTPAVGKDRASTRLPFYASLLLGPQVKEEKETNQELIHASFDRFPLPMLWWRQGLSILQASISFSYPLAGQTVAAAGCRNRTILLRMKKPCQQKRNIGTPARGRSCTLHTCNAG
ncbi:hypothetical protein BB8028_0001g02520 [Beauveria bassiana]|uniref:Uncharacterized protein n=1 Tax=Beauveria bassiana TaxID=176275 RepID=A0A2S7XWY0_BEABA|nr:hypothetical protein BB8028_0001g02520 [Beauveria bassiana]